MSKTSQATFGDIVEAHGPDTKEEVVTKTVVCPLETSREKTAHIRDCVGRWQEIAGYMSNVMISHHPNQWRVNISTNDHVIHREFPENNGLKLSCARVAANTVAASYSSWRSNGQPTKNFPSGDFGSGSYMGMTKSDISIVENDRGFGAKLKLVPYDPVWFHIGGGRYQHEILNEIVSDSGPIAHGSAEIHVHDSGSVALHLTYNIPVDVYRAPDVDRWIGVDLGEAKMWVASPVEPDGPIGAAVFDQHSAEFRETRERLSREGDRLRERGDLNAVKAQQDLRNYTDTMTHTAACEIADLAAEYAPCGIAIEDLTGYRKDAEDPIHDWPYFDIQQKILYKANERGLPVRKVNPAGTSAECWKCGSDEHATREEREWLVCDGCGDRRHADVNAAINIGLRAAEK